MLSLCNVCTAGLLLAGSLHLLSGLPESGNLLNGVQMSNSQMDNQSTYSTLFTDYIYNRNNPNISGREYFIRPVPGTIRMEQNGGFSQQNTTQQKQPVRIYQQTPFLGQKANDPAQQTSISQLASSPEKQSDIMRPERQLNLQIQQINTTNEQQQTVPRLDQQRELAYNSDIPGVRLNHLLQQSFAREQQISPVLNTSAELDSTQAGKLKQLINFLVQNSRITEKQINDAYQKTNTFEKLLRRGELLKDALPNISVQTSNVSAELSKRPSQETTLSGKLIANPFQEAMFQQIFNQVNQTLGTILPLSILGAFPRNTDQQTSVSEELSSGPVQESSSQTEELSESSQQISNEEKQPNIPILPKITNKEMPLSSFNQTSISRRDPSSLIQDSITKEQASSPIKKIIQERNQTISQVQQPAIDLMKQTITNALPQHSPAQQAFSQSEQTQTNTLMEQSRGPIQQTNIQVKDASGSNQQTASPSEQEEANVPEETPNFPLPQAVMPADPNQTISREQQMNGQLSGVKQLIDTTSERVESNIPAEQPGGPLQQTGIKEEEKHASSLGETSGSLGNQTITDAEEQGNPAQQIGSQMQKDTRGELFNGLIQRTSTKLEQTAITNQPTFNRDQSRTNISVKQPIVQNDHMPQSSKWEQLNVRIQQIINKTGQLSGRMLDTGTIEKPQEINIREDRLNSTFQQMGIQEQQQLNILKQQTISPVLSNFRRNITDAQQQPVNNLYPIHIQGDQKQTSTIRNQSNDQNQRARNQIEALNGLIQPTDAQREETSALKKQPTYHFQQTGAQKEQSQSNAIWENIIGRIKPTNVHIEKTTTFSQQADDIQKQNKTTTLMKRGDAQGQLKPIAVFGEQVISRDQQQSTSQLSKPGHANGLIQKTGAITKQETSIQEEKPRGLFMEQPIGKFQQASIEAKILRQPLKPTGTQEETNQIITSQEQLYGQSLQASIQSAKPSGDSSEQAGATKEQEANTQEEQAGGSFQQSGTQQNKTIFLREEGTGRAQRTNLQSMETSRQMGNINEQVQNSTLTLIEQQTSGPVNQTISNAQPPSDSINKTIWDAQKQNSVVQQTVAQSEQEASSNTLEQSSNIGHQASLLSEQQEANEEQLSGSLQQTGIPEEQNPTRVSIQQSVDPVKQAITTADQVSSLVKQSGEMPTGTIRKQFSSVPQQLAIQVGQRLAPTQPAGTQSEQQEANMEEEQLSSPIQKTTITTVPTSDYVTSTTKEQLSDLFRLPNIQGVQLRGFSAQTNTTQENQTYVSSQKLIVPLISVQQRLMLLEQARNQNKPDYMGGEQQNITDQQYSAKEGQTHRGIIGQQSSGIFPQENTQGVKLSVVNQRTVAVTDRQLNTQEQSNTIGAQPSVLGGPLNVLQQPRAPESHPSSLYVPVTTSPLREPLRILGQPQAAYNGPSDAQRIKPVLEKYACPKYKYRIEGNTVIFEGIERGCNLIVNMASVISSVSKDINEPVHTVEPRRIDKSDLAEMRTADGTIAANGECPGWHIWTTRLAMVHIQTSPTCHIVVHLGKKFRGSSGGRPLRVMYATVNRLNRVS